jgi:hypothetical protein
MIRSKVIATQSCNLIHGKDARCIKNLTCQMVVSIVLSYVYDWEFGINNTLFQNNFALIF